MSVRFPVVLAYLLLALLTSRAHGEEQTLIVRIGHVASTSGQIARLGLDNENGARLAIEEANLQGIKIGGKAVRFELLTKDDRGSTDHAKVVAQELVKANVKAVVGHLLSGTSVATAQIYADSGIVHVVPSATNPRLTNMGIKSIFRLIGNDAYLGAGLAGWVVQQPIEPVIYVISEGSPYATGMASVFIEGVERFGGVIAGRMTVGGDTGNTGELIAQLKQSGANWVFYAGMPERAGPLLRKMREGGISMRMLGGDTLCTQTMLTLAGQAVNYGEVVCAEAGITEGTLDDHYQQFQARFQKRFNKPVEMFAGHAYDSVRVVVAAMKAADSMEPADYLPKLAALKFDGVIGPIQFDKYGDLQSGMITLKTTNGKSYFKLAVGYIPR